MNNKDVFSGITEAIFHFLDINEPWRFAVFLIIMAAGISVFEILFRYIKIRFMKFIHTKGYSPENWNLSLFKPSMRLAFFALIIRLTEPLFIISHDQQIILRITEFFILSLSVIFLFY